MSFGRLRRADEVLGEMPIELDRQVGMPSASARRPASMSWVGVNCGGACVNMGWNIPGQETTLKDYNRLFSPRPTNSQLTNDLLQDADMAADNPAQRARSAAVSMSRSVVTEPTERPRRLARVSSSACPVDQRTPAKGANAGAAPQADQPIASVLGGTITASWRPSRRKA